MSSNMNWKQVKAEAEFFYLKHRQLIGRCVKTHLEDKKNILMTVQEEMSEMEEMLTSLRSMIQEEITTGIKNPQEGAITNAVDRITAILNKLENNRNTVKDRITTVSERLREQLMELEGEAQAIEGSSKRIAQLEETEHTDP